MAPAGAIRLASPQTTARTRKIMKVPASLKAPAYWARAKRQLSEADPVLGNLILRYKGLTLASRGDAFQTLARSIVGQQISVKAAQSVWDRFAIAVGDMQPHRVLKLSEIQLRGCGLSGQKVKYLCDLSERF